MNKTLITTLLIFTVGFAHAQSKKDQIITLNYKKDSLNLVIQNERLDSRSNSDSLNLVILNERQACKRNIDSLNTTHVEDKEKLKLEIESINDSINIISEELTVLNDSIILQKSIILELEEMTPNGMFQTFEAEEWYELVVCKISDGNNLEGKNVTQDYCDCMNHLIQVMKNNEDYDEGMGGYVIDGEATMSPEALKLSRAKQILLYWSLEECSLFNYPDFFEQLFSPEAKALNEASNIYFKD